MSHVTGLILAAGASTRMGSQKPLLKIGDKTLLEDQYFRLKDAGIESVAVVVGAEAEKIKAAHRVLKCRWIMNEAWEKGSFSSLAAGVKAIDGNILLLPIDTIGVPPSTIDHIVNAGLKYNSNIVPTHNGRGGHPVFLAAVFLCEVVRRAPLSARLDHLIKEWPHTKRIEVATDTILRNANRPEDMNGVHPTF